MGSFSRSFRALLWRNFLYRKRKPLSSVIEFLLPALIIMLLVRLKDLVDVENLMSGMKFPAIYPNDRDTIRPLSFTDYVTGIQASRICKTSKYGYKKSITGIVKDWSIPFVHCDPEGCNFNGEDGTKYCEYRVLALAPKNEHSESFARWIYEKNPGLLKNSSVSLPFDYDMIQIFDTEDEIDSYVTGKNYGDEHNPKIAAAIILNAGAPSYNYAIRINSTNYNRKDLEIPGMPTTPTTSRTFVTNAKTPQMVCISISDPNQSQKWAQTCTGQYMYNGAITMQRLIDDWIIYDSGAEAKGSNVAENGVSFVTFPTREFAMDSFYSIIQNVVPLLAVLGFMYPTSSMIRMIVSEKELRQKEFMKMMSISDFAIESSWFISYFMFFSPSAALVAWTTNNLFNKSDFAFLFIFWQLAMITIILYSMAISAFFTKSSRAGMIGIMAFFGGFFRATQTSLDSERSLVSIFSSSIHPVSTMTFGLQIISALEDAGSGLNSNSLTFSDYPSGYNFYYVLLSQCVDICFWYILVWYRNRIAKGEYGRPYPLHFPFTKTYWFGGQTSTNVDDLEEQVSMIELSSRSAIKMEPVSETLLDQVKEGKCIEIRNLTKTFEEKTAVDNLSLTMYNGQVTALLGHNGAGKTTTINMLTGMLTPTSGSAFVGGKDITTQMPEIRENVGICLQHDCLFPTLTVKEHIEFFAQVKGLYEQKHKSRDEMEKSVMDSLRDVALTEKRDTFVNNLSGGMRRKLSVAIAFCGDSDVVFLDEPTSGMDPFSRRFTWNVIRQYRSNRCIVLTTHFMDEADLLGDRIAIMAEGGLRCVGSSLFLKKAYGVGYQLTIEKKPYGRFEATKDSNELSEVEKSLCTIIKESVTEAKELNNVGTEMSFQLPLDASDRFGPMFQKLDLMVQNEMIATYGVSITTLDEVFQMVARGFTMEKHSRSRSDGGVEPLSINHSDLDSTGFEEKQRSSGTFAAQMKSGKEEFKRHLFALLVKRAKNFKRDKRAWFCTSVLPVLLALLAFVQINFFVINRNMDPLVLSLDDYNVEMRNDEMRHPVPYGVSGKFTCEPGNCVSETTSFRTDMNESYSMCGWKISGNNVMCSIGDDVTSIFSRLGGGGNEVGVKPVKDGNSRNINSMMKFIDSSASDFAASQYGALYFKHDASSKMSNGDNYSEYVYEKCKDNRGDYRSEEQCANYIGLSYVVSTNFTAIHAPLLYQAIADETIINAAIGNDEKVSISATIHPLPITYKERRIAKEQNSILAWFVLIFSFPFITGSFASFIVAEKQSKAKHLQKVAGVRISAYWLSSYLWDVINYQIPLWLIVIMLFAMNIESFITTERGACYGVIVTLFLFGPASASFSYCVSFLFESPSTCNYAIICGNFLIGLAGPLVVYVMRMITSVMPGTDLSHSMAVTLFCLRFIPSFNLGKAIYFLLNVESFELFTGESLSVWSSEILLYEVICLGVQCIAYLFLAICLDHWTNNPLIQQHLIKVYNFAIYRFISIVSRRGRPVETLSQYLDEDVAAEEERVQSGRADDDLILVKALSKIYWNNKLAVDEMSLGIPAGQCFGLLGTNGAGKTTTLGILTSDFAPTKGDALLGGYSVTKEPEETRRRIGYCPQFDAHFVNMTGREHVELYAAIKGVSYEDMGRAVASKLEEVGLSAEDSDKLSSNYSGGMKRKLSVACAMIGQPQIMFLDEPSTGLDPVARRDLWKVISKMVSNVDAFGDAQTSVILTTHSMEECEALCPRIGIMAGGKLRCLGSAQHLKSRFGTGYQLELKIALVHHNDEDYKNVFHELASALDQPLALGDSVMVNLAQTISMVESLTKDSSISSLISEDENSVGFVIYKNATSEAGVALDALSAFCVEEIRMIRVIDFVNEMYSGAIVRERQDNKIRFEVKANKDIRISNLFSTIESKKLELQLTDYGVSQTSLEQVFNMHAEEAELEKNGKIDN